MDRPMPNFAFNMMSSIQRVQNIVSKKQLTNVETIHSDCQTGLPDDSVDIVLLYDIFHMLTDPQAILAELHRILRKDGTLSVSGHHTNENEILSGVTNSQLFRLNSKDERTYSFSKQ